MVRIVKLVKNQPLLLIIVVVGTGLVYNIYKAFGSVSNVLKDEPVDEPLDASKASISPQKAIALASVLKTAMHTITGTDEDTIYRVLGKVTKENFALIYNAFGKVHYSKTFGNEGVPIIDDKLDLLSWLNAELNTDEIDHLTALNPMLTQYL